MRLTDAHVTNYRSVEDSGAFTVEPDVTCLVGKNEPRFCASRPAWRRGSARRR